MSKFPETEEIAARLLIRREEADWSPGDEAEFATWMDADPRNKIAFWRLQHGWDRIDRAATLGTSAPHRPAVRQASRPIWPALAASIAICVVAGALSLAVGDRLGRKTYSTEVGGLETVPLPDGSKVELNTTTKLKAAVNGRARDVWLDQGEAYFEVAHDPRHPFVVHAGAKTITVIGTKFSVRRDGDRVEVAVVEGKVRVADTDTDAGSLVPAAPPPVLTRGDMIIAKGPAMIATAKSVETVTNALSWREGKLVFDQSTLGDVASEFNRYNRKKLVIADRGVAAMRIGGTFQAENMDGFVHLLQQAYGLKVEDDGDTVKISS